MLISSASAYIRAVASERVIASVIAETIPEGEPIQPRSGVATQHNTNTPPCVRACVRRRAARR